MTRQYITENNKSRERLVKLVGNITDAELRTVIYKEGWTVAAALAHLAFWDERRLVLVKYWRQNVFTPSGLTDMDTHVINDALVPFFLAMPVRKAAELSIIAAMKVDKELEKLPAKLVTQIEASGDRHGLNRGIHRHMHLEEIEALLKIQRGAK
jgi:hypothetical protein